MPRLLFFLPDVLLHHGLSADASMVHPREPQGGEALHSLVPGDCIFNREHQGMSQMKGPSNIRRRDHHHKLLLVRVGEDVFFIGMEEFLLLPPSVPSALHLLRMVLVLDRLTHIFLLASRGLVDELCLLNNLLLLFLFRLIGFAHGSLVALS